MLLIFDWDGTLADSQAHIVAALQQTIGEMGLAARTDEQCASIIGLGLIESARTLLRNFQSSKPVFFCELYAQNFLALGQSGYPLRLFDGVVETLNKLLDNGHVLAVATGKSRRGLNRVLSALDMQHYFIATRTADETMSKPNPAMLHELLAETDYSAADAVMIGDTTFDMEMAVNAGVHRISANYGVHDEQQLRKFEPVFALERIEDLMQWSRLN